jgi:hypothetical protein
MILRHDPTSGRPLNRRKRNLLRNSLRCRLECKKAPRKFMWFSSGQCCSAVEFSGDLTMAFTASRMALGPYFRSGKKKIPRLRRRLAGTTAADRAPPVCSICTRLSGQIFVSWPTWWDAGRRPLGYSAALTASKLRHTLRTDERSATVVTDRLTW